MNILVTGAGGTIGRVFCAQLTARGDVPVPWNRRMVPIDDYHAMETFVRSSGVDAVVHLAIASRPTGRDNESWLVNYEWSSELAWITRALGIPFLFASTVLVFSDRAEGPFLPDSEPDASEGYGGEKRRAEERVRYQNPAARIARLGWQIEHSPQGNQMVAWLEQRHREDGEVRASRRWLPACSFLEDTVVALRRLIDAPPGIYHLDANRRWTFFDIATALNAHLGGGWTIVPDDSFAQDQRMRDERVAMPSLRERLPDLP